MKLRFLILCDKNGVKSEPSLQVFDEDFGWEDVPIEEMKTWEYEAEQGNE